MRPSGKWEIGSGKLSETKSRMVGLNGKYLKNNTLKRQSIRHNPLK